MENNQHAQLLRENLRLLTRRLGLLDRGEATCCGMSLSQCHTIVEIGRAGKLSVNELAELLNLDKSTVSRTVDALVNDGVLLRSADPADRRYVALTLSDKGREMFAGIEDRSSRYFTAICNSLPADKQPQVIESLKYLVRAMTDSCNC